MNLVSFFATCADSDGALNLSEYVFDMGIHRE